MPNRPHDVVSPTLKDMLRAACVLEATAPKAGNVHPGYSFTDLTYDDFLVSADAAAPILARSAELGVGPAILASVTATRERVGRNTNLGMVLLLAPLAAVPDGVRLADGIGRVLAGLTREDADCAYRAIRLAHPGGMGQVEREDVGQPPTTTLLEAMRLAASRDLVARQYIDHFSLVLEFGLRYLSRVADFEQQWETAIVGLQLELMARHGDSLIARKCGSETSAEAARQAAAVLKAGGRTCDKGGWLPASPAGTTFPRQRVPKPRDDVACPSVQDDAKPGAAGAQERFEQFDEWLRADGNRRNPGTTADLIAAMLFAAFREGVVPVIVPHVGPERTLRPAK